MSLLKTTVKVVGGPRCEHEWLPTEYRLGHKCNWLGLQLGPLVEYCKYCRILRMVTGIEENAVCSGTITIKQ